MTSATPSVTKIDDSLSLRRLLSVELSVLQESVPSPTAGAPGSTDHAAIRSWLIDAGTDGV